MDTLHLLTQLLLIAGALNWGLVSLGMPDAVKSAADLVQVSQLEQYVKLLVAVAGLYALYRLVL
jgi:uncharacterized membrane protein YuzA (DUF378 family)